jgi:hypothetical protein
MSGDGEIGVNPAAAISGGGLVRDASVEFGSKVIGLFQGSVSQATDAAVLPPVQAGYHGFLDQGLTALQNIQRFGTDLGERISSGGAFAAQTDGANATGFGAAGNDLGDQAPGAN